MSDLPPPTSDDRADGINLRRRKPRFTAEQRNDTWTVRDREQHRLIVHKAHWPETTARHIAEVLNAHPWHADEWEWEA